MNYEKIKEELKKILSDYRYNHSLNVAQVAKELAKHYCYDEEKAYLAGLLHDIAIEYTDEQNQKIITEYNLPSEMLDKNYHKVLHADIGAIVAKERYNIDDDIYNAIKYHALGNIPMALLDKIIFVADKIEPGKKYPDIDKERELAFLSIDKALILCIENNLKKLTKDNKYINPKSRKVLKYLKEGEKNVKNK